MPQFEAALFTYLSSDPGVSALVGDRIYPSKLEEGCLLPAVSWNRVSTRRVYTFDSYEDTDAWVNVRIQVNCWSNNPLEAMDVGEAILLALSGYEGDMSGQLIGSAMADNEFDEYQAPTKYHRRIMDFLITYEDDLNAAS